MTVTVPVGLSRNMREKYGKKRAGRWSPLRGGGLEKGLQGPPSPQIFLESCAWVCSWCLHGICMVHMKGVVCACMVQG